MALTETTICNMALARIGAKRINDLDTATSNAGIHCRTHYEQTRNAVLRSAWWAFATDRKTLARDVETPDFEWDYQYHLPNDYLARKSIYENSISDENLRSFAIEGDFLLTDDTEVNLRYIKLVEDVAKFDPLFVDALVLAIAIKLAPPLSGADAKLQQLLQKEFDAVISKARTVNAQEVNTIGKRDLGLWNDARY